MKSWPEIYLPPITDVDFPILTLKDTNLGMIPVSSNKKLRMYVCGITPYDATHLGHAATYLAFDLLNRYQRLSDKEVIFVENVTDVDDPLLERAKRDNQGWQELAHSQIELFRSDMTSLRILPPEYFVKVTDSMNLVEDFIGLLEKHGHIYSVEKDLYFSCKEFLSDLPLTMDEAVKVFAERGGDPQREGKRHPLDPLVWSANVEGEPGWESRYGFGRPGWHIECTAIACKYLDTYRSNPVIDIQGGGSDLIFPHHFMSSQLVRAALGRDFSTHYIHTAMIGFKGEKMSKSKGNLVFVSKLIREGLDPMIIRWALLSGHYQQDRAWSLELLHKATAEVALIRSALAQNLVAPTRQLIEDIVQAVAENLNSPVALNRLVEWADESRKEPLVNESGVVSRAIDSLLGLAL
ncbi:MAG: cysteinyl-tRNA synthetase [Actinobacteria bacterium]|nr:cysteinyl-tRNA synthetase [Actinomycetota bacterium]